jgi:hypothetical protein
LQTQTWAWEGQITRAQPTDFDSGVAIRAKVLQALPGRRQTPVAGL